LISANREDVSMKIRRAVQTDQKEILKLLAQVLEIHHAGRPDIFKSGAVKYRPAELTKLLQDENRPIFVAEVDGQVAGYAFCVLRQYRDDNILTDIKTLYIDDLCVDETMRGQRIGQALYDFVVDFAKREGCYNLTLHVWECNTSARKFYEAMGMHVQKTEMEKIL